MVLGPLRMVLLRPKTAYLEIFFKGNRVTVVVKMVDQVIVEAVEVDDDKYDCFVSCCSEINLNQTYFMLFTSPAM